MSPPGLSDAERRDRLRLARTERVGPVAFRELLGRFGSAGKVLAALPELSRRAGRSTPLRPPSEAEAERELERGEALGARLVVLGDPLYPPALTAVDAPPPLLWVRGSASLLARPALAIVGARIASAAGQRFARSLAGELGEAGFVVTSGLARGIDGAAHAGALQTGTVAVLAGGVDDVYPPEHAELYDAVLAQGCVVSENPPGRTAKAQDFPRRNRIISGLSLGVVVVEAELRSGSLITARLAAEQGREVFAVPGSPLDPRARGANDLIRQGATLCEGIDDILRAVTPQMRLGEPPRAFDPDAPTTDLDAPDLGDPGLLEAVAALLSPTPVPRDELVRTTGAPPAAVYAALVELSLAGRAELLPGGLIASA